MAMQQARFLGPSHDRLVEGTIKNTISNVCLTFRENGMPNLTKVADGLPRAFRNENPNQVQQKVVPSWVILSIARINQSEFQLTLGQLVTVGFFFVMRSREYIKLPRAEEGRKRILALGNLKFIWRWKVPNHNDLELKCADFTVITFEMQKKEDKNDTAHTSKTGERMMCPVQQRQSLCAQLEATPKRTTTC
jgi:hypothetical protein